MSKHFWCDKHKTYVAQGSVAWEKYHLEKEGKERPPGYISYDQHMLQVNREYEILTYGKTKK